MQQYRHDHQRWQTWQSSSEAAAEIWIEGDEDNKGEMVGGGAENKERPTERRSSSGGSGCGESGRICSRGNESEPNSFGSGE